jgi:hypothetical protein
MSTLSDMSTATLVCFQLPLTFCIIFHPFTFHLYVTLPVSVFFSYKNTWFMFSNPFCHSESFNCRILIGHLCLLLGRFFPPSLPFCLALYVSVFCSFYKPKFSILYFTGSLFTKLLASLDFLHPPKTPCSHTPDILFQICWR